MAPLAPALAVDEVVGERLRVALGETERTKPREDVRFVQLRTGSGLNVCFAASSASAIEAIA